MGGFVVVCVVLVISLIVNCLSCRNKKRKPKKKVLKKKKCKGPLGPLVVNHDIENPPEPKPRDRTRRLKIFRFHNTFPRPQLAMRLSGIDTTDGVIHNDWIQRRKTALAARRKSNFPSLLIKPARSGAQRRKSERALDFIKRFKIVKESKPAAFSSPPQPQCVFEPESKRSSSHTKRQNPESTPLKVKSI